MPTNPAASRALVTGENEKRGTKSDEGRAKNERRGLGSARTAAMIRARAAGSVTTGRCASRAIHSTYECSVESLIFDPLPAFAQTIARALDTHLQRRDADTSKRRHLFVAHLFDVLQEKR